jgi:hypothetical protein
MKVTISGTMAKDRKVDSGLDEIGDKIRANRLTRIAVVGIIEYHGYHDVVGQPESVSIRFAAIEPVPGGKEDTIVRNLIDKMRRGRGVGATELTLFDAVPNPDGDGPWPGDPDFKAPAGDPFMSEEAQALAKARPANGEPFNAKALDVTTIDDGADAKTVAGAAVPTDPPADDAKPKRKRAAPSRALASVPDDAA